MLEEGRLSSILQEEGFKKEEAVFFNKASQILARNYAIDPKLYSAYDVKRGLRYATGRGVLVGLTSIGDVVGYKMEDGKKVPIPGRLIYRGYSIEDIVHDTEAQGIFGYEECVYLLLFGELPTREQLAKFRLIMGRNLTLPENFTEDMIMKAPSNNIMNKLARGVLASYSYDDNPEDRSVPNVLRQCIELISRFSTLVAYAYQAKRRFYDKKSMYIHNPIPELSVAQNFLRLIRSDKQYSALEAHLLDLVLILHAEHGGGNNSSLTIHVVASADTDTYSAIAAAVGSLKGNRHGGANIRVVQMMADLKANVKNLDSDKEIKDYLRKVSNKEAFDRTSLIYGQGHAVYTITDPRAVLLKEKARELAVSKGMLEDFELYETVERLSPEVIYEKHGDAKRICTNVDFYSGFVYTMLGIPPELFTPLFAIARIAGWSAHRIEELVGGGKIYRPAYKNILPERKYIPFSAR